MPLYRSTFERTNFSLSPPLRQRADVLLKSELSADESNRGALEAAMWAAMWEQNPHWANPSGPPGAPSGWSSVLWDFKLDPVDEVKNMAVAWHIPQSGWLMADGVTGTEDVDLAGRFTAEQILELQTRYPGERHSMVMPKLVSTIWNEDGSPRCYAPFRLRFDEFVFWGYGPRTPGYERVDVAVTRISGLDIEFPLEMPDSYDGQKAVEYERRRCWAWKLHSDDRWHVAESTEAAQAAARLEALKQMRRDGHHCTSQWLAIKHLRELVNAFEVPPP